MKLKIKTTNTIVTGKTDWKTSEHQIFLNLLKVFRDIKFQLILHIYLSGYSNTPELIELQAMS